MGPRRSETTCRGFASGSAPLGYKLELTEGQRRYEAVGRSTLCRPTMQKPLEVIPHVLVVDGVARGVVQARLGLRPSRQLCVGNAYVGNNDR
jgi:hypothetical protein